MKFEHNNMEDFFKEAFTGYKVDNQEQTWFEIDSRVSRNNFFKFNLTGFNVYYLVLIVSTFTITSYMGIDRYLLNNNQSHQENVPANIQYIYDTITKIKVIHKTIETDDIKVIQSDDHTNLQNNSVREEQNVIDPTENNAQIYTDTVFINKDQSGKVIIDTVKTQVYVKPEVVVKRDTVRMKVPKSNKKNKKH